MTILHTGHGIVGERDCRTCNATFYWPLGRRESCLEGHTVDTLGMLQSGALGRHRPPVLRN